MWLILVASIVTSFQTVSYGDRIVIRKHQVGPVSIGALAQSVYEAFRGRSRLVDLALEGHLSPALELTFPKSEVQGGVVVELVARDSTLVVWRISVTDPAIRTDKGVGVGSSVEELRTAYRVDGIGSGEGRVFLRVEELAASFELNRSGPGGDRLWEIRDPKHVPSDVKIVSVLLTR